MGQIVLNYIVIFVIPALIGAAVRLIFIKKQKGYLVTVVLSCVTVLIGLFAIISSGSGNEAAGLFTLSACLSTLCSLLCGAIAYIIRKTKKKAE